MHEDLGYNLFFEEKRKQAGVGDFPVARVIAEHKGLYELKDKEGEYIGKITGKQMFQASSREDYPAVGDWVWFEKADEEHAVIHGVLPRQTILKRRHGDKNRSGEKSDVQVIAANIDTAFIVQSVGRDYSLNRFERYMSIAQDGGVQPVIVLNKIDMLSEEELEERIRELKNRFPGIAVLATSVVSEKGTDALKAYIQKGKTYCFLGSSGVGKSSLINALINANEIKTGEISAYSNRGTHVTTARHMYFLKTGGMVVDNPGIREVGMTDVMKGVDDFFGKITELGHSCRYSDCTHTNEPGCEVMRAVETGELDEEKYRNYLGLKKEVQYYEMSDAEKRKKERAFGKFIQQAKKTMRRKESDG